MTTVKKTSVRTEVSALTPSTDTPASVQRDTGKEHIAAGTHILICLTIVFNVTTCLFLCVAKESIAVSPLTPC